MSAYFRSSFYKRFTRFVLQALSGNLSLRYSIMACIFISTVILAYVSMQIYASRIIESNSRLRTQETLCREQLNELTGRYMSLSSRKRIVHYCEKKLNMTETGDDSLVRVAVETNAVDDLLLVGEYKKETWYPTPLAFRNARSSR